MKFNVRYLAIAVLVLVSGEIVVGQEASVKDGYVKFYYANGNVSSEGNMKNGKPDGYWKSYYESGTLKSEGNRENFKLAGPWKFYNEQAALVNEFNYKDGKKDGLQKNFYDTGVIKSEETDSMDVLHGMSRFYNEEGELTRQSNFVNGIETGISKEFSNGRIITLTTYKNGYITKEEKINRTDRNGMKQGSWKDLYENDAVKNEGFYRDGKRDGIFKEFDRNGRVVKKEEYRNDILVQTVKAVEEKYDVKRSYYPDGSVKTIGTYKRGLPEGIFREYDAKGNLTDTAKVYSGGRLLSQGKLDDQGREQGLWREFYEDGKIKSEGNYKDGRREKEWNFYYNNGQVEQTGEYVKGKPSGEWIKYFSDGKLNRHEFYENGKENGIMTEYSRDSVIIAKGNYIEGKKEGVWNFNNNGYLAEGKFLEDREDGLWKQFSPDNKRVLFEGSFVDGQENGEHTYYYEDGHIKELQHWRLGMREGTWKKYDMVGNLIIEIAYSGGSEVKLNGVKVSQ